MYEKDSVISWNVELREVVQSKPISWKQNERSAFYVKHYNYDLKPHSGS